MASEKRLIDANALMKWLWDTVDDYTWGERKYTADDIYNMLDDYPTVDAVELVHGRWEIITDDYDCELMRCSVCENEFYDGDNDTVDCLHNYCPHCGAKMDGGNEDGS